MNIEISNEIIAFINSEAKYLYNPEYMFKMGDDLNKTNSAEIL